MRHDITRARTPIRAPDAPISGTGSPRSAPAGRAATRGFATFLRALALALPGLALGLLAVGARPAHAAQPTLRTIVIDGDLTDWTPVLVNPAQVTRDGDGSRIDCSASSDRDCPIASAGRDLRLFAWTYDAIHLFVYVERQGSTSNTETFWLFMDLDDDGLMEAGEKGWRVVSTGNGATSSEVYLYTPANPGGDPMVDAAGYGDGYTLPGSLGPAAIFAEGAPDGGSPNGLVFEERLPWSVIGVAPGTAIGFHVASSNSRNPAGVGTQVDDNVGALGGGGASLHYDDVRFSPDRSGFTAPGGTVTYLHDVVNAGSRDASFALRAVSSIGTSVTLSADTDGDGTPDAIIATDVGGDGDFVDAGDSIAPGWDRDGDGFPETPVLAPGGVFHLVVEVRAGVVFDGRFDELVVEAFLPSNPGQVTASVTDTTHVGLIVVRFDQDRTTGSGVAIDDAIDACNAGAPQVLDLTATSSVSSPLELHSDAGCDGTADALLARDDDGDGTWDAVLAGDSDADGLPDTGMLATGECACFVVRVTVAPGTPIGASDVTTVTARAAPGGTESGSATLSTRVAGAIEIFPDYLLADGTGKFSGAGKPVFFPHVAQANGTAPDVVDFASVPPVNDTGWDVVIWSDPDGDGSIADGRVITRTEPIAPHGGTSAFVVEVRIPDLTIAGVQSTTVVTGTSVASPGSSDTVTDQVIVSMISTYSDPLFSFAATAFAPCDTIYVIATGLRRRDSYELLYADGLENGVSFVSPWIADDAGVAEDAYAIRAGDVAGTWVIEVREDGAVIGRRTVTIESAARVTDVRTDRASYPRSGAGLVVDMSVASDNLIAPFLNLELDAVLLDASGSLYYDPATGAFVPFTVGDASWRQPVPRMDPGSTYDAQWVEGAISYPADGAYCVVVSLAAPCGTILARGVTCFTVGAGVEQCANGVDDDGDSLVDCQDPECALAPNCRETRCHDGADDDGDTLVDCADPDCRFDPGCQENCSNGTDDDGDGRIDCLDPDCAAEPRCTETACHDLIDNDGDGLTDCGDPDCESDPACKPELPCDDGIDNDLDTAVDCDDADCALDPACANDDLDGDGVPNADDCAPLDPGAWSVPIEVPRLDVSRAGTALSVLSWTDLSAQAGPAIVYDIATGLVSELWQDDGFARAECLSRLRPATTALDPRRVPALPDAYYYLVRGVNACGAGTWGSDSFGNARVIGACAP